jgi:hypothetical protein
LSTTPVETRIVLLSAAKHLAINRGISQILLPPGRHQNDILLSLDFQLELKQCPIQNPHWFCRGNLVIFSIPSKLKRHLAA